MEIILTEHASQQITARGLDEAMVLEVARDPEQVVDPNNDLPPIAQTRIKIDGKMYLLRVVFRDIEHIEAPVRLIITAYRTSQVEKYWQDAD